MLMVFGAFAVSAANNNSNEPMASDQPMKIMESNNYYDATTLWMQIFAVSWITDGDYTGRVTVGDYAGFDPTWEGAYNIDDRGATESDDVHHCTVKSYGSYGTATPLAKLTTYYYYIESPSGKIWGEDPAAPGESKLKASGGTAFVFKTADDTVSGVAPPIRGYVQYGPDSSYRSEELVYITAHKSGSPDDKPGWPLSQLTVYGGPSAHDGYYGVFPKYFQKADYSGFWTIASGDPVHGEGEGSADGTGSADSSWAGPPLDMPDIVLWPPNHPPEADFTVDPEDSPCGQPAVWDTVTFTSTSTDDYTSEPDLYFAWDFGDGSPVEEGLGSAGYNVRTHEYYSSGTFSVSLTVTDDGSPPLSDTMIKDVKIWPNRVSTTPLDVRETNLKDVACKISWHTCIDTTGYVIWGSAIRTPVILLGLLHIIHIIIK
jgi:hypothetical protein